MSEQDLVINPLAGKPLSAEDYAIGNSETRTIMGKVFAFRFTEDFRRTYKGDRFIATHHDLQGKIISYRTEKQIECQVVNSKVTLFALDFISSREEGYIIYDDDVEFHMMIAPTKLAFRHSHILVIGPKNHTGQDWLKLLSFTFKNSEGNYSFSIEDSNPDNNSFLQTKDGRKLNGVCTLGDLLEGQFKLNDSDSFTLMAKKGKESYSLKYSFIPFGELSLGSK